MSNDYTLPPIKSIPSSALRDPESLAHFAKQYGHACAEHVRAEITPRVVEILKERDRLRAEVEDWRKLLDPVNLHVNLLQGKPAHLTKAQLAHLLGQDYTALLAEVEALRAGIERALTRARVFDDGSDGADGESARSCVEILGELIAARKGEGSEL